MYPGVQKLNEIIQSPFCYDDYIKMEKELCNLIGWELYIITPFDLLQHFMS